MITQDDNQIDIQKVPGLFSRLTSRLREVVSFGYDSAETSHRRRPPDVREAAEDFFQRSNKRKRLVGGPRDAVRNITLLGWAVRKHLDFCTLHTIGWNTPDRGLNRALAEWVNERSKKKNFDIRGNHDRDRFWRTVEARKILDGDLAAIKLSSRHLQAIEADRIKNPSNTKIDGAEWVNGVLVDETTQQKRRISVWDRASSQTTSQTFAREVPFENLIWSAWHDSHYRFDAVRGVGPITAALNDFIDVDEGKLHAKSKLKVAQMMGLVVSSAYNDGLGEHTQSGQVTDSDDETNYLQWWADMGSGPSKLEVDVGSDVKLLDPKTGATEVVGLLDWCAAIAIKCLDLPVNFLDESRTNFFGSKAGVTFYKMSCHHKQIDVQEAQREWLEWQLDMSVGLGEVALPRTIDLAMVKRSARFTPRGIPFFDKSREVVPTIQSFVGGVDTLTNIIADTHGRQRDEFLDELADDWSALEERGITIGHISQALQVQETNNPVDPTPTPEADDAEDAEE